MKELFLDTALFAMLLGLDGALAGYFGPNGRVDSRFMVRLFPGGEDDPRPLAARLYPHALAADVALQFVRLVVRSLALIWLVTSVGMHVPLAAKTVLQVVAALGYLVASEMFLGRGLAGRAYRHTHWSILRRSILASILVLVWPLTRPIRSLADLAWQVTEPEMNGEGLSPRVQQELRSMIDAVERGGLVEEEQTAMLRAIVAFAELEAHDIMTPRIDIAALPREATLGDAVELAVREGHSRIPVYRDTVDQIEAVTSTLDLLRYWGEDAAAPLPEEALREPYFIPESMKLDDLLHELQARRTHLAVVVDEYGGTAGLITLEDVLEEIVGEIRDEFDEEPEPYRPLDDGRLLLQARLPIEEVEELLEVELDREDVDTLGGLIMNLLGRVPRPGDHAEYRGVEFEVGEVDGRRVMTVVALAPSRTPAPSEKE